MSNVIEFTPRKPDAPEPLDGVEMCSVTINGLGDVSVWVSDYIETTEQFNWLIAKIGAAMSSVISSKQDAMDA